MTVPGSCSVVKLLSIEVLRLDWQHVAVGKTRPESVHHSMHAARDWCGADVGWEGPGIPRRIPGRNHRPASSSPWCKAKVTSSERRRSPSVCMMRPR